MVKLFKVTLLQRNSMWLQMVNLINTIKTHWGAMRLCVQTLLSILRDAAADGKGERQQRIKCKLIITSGKRCVYQLCICCWDWSKCWSDRFHVSEGRWLAGSMLKSSCCFNCIYWSISLREVRSFVFVSVSTDSGCRLCFCVVDVHIGCEFTRQCTEKVGTCRREKSTL